MKILPSAKTRQRGMAAIALVALLVLAGIFFSFSGSSFTTVRVDRDRTTNDALAKAKDALVGFAVSHVAGVPVAGAPMRPGQLPCPDVNDDGVQDSDAAGACTSLIGRLPWFTLGLPDLRDDNGERLWYAVSNDFRTDYRVPPVVPAVVPLNSDTAYLPGNVSLALAGTTPAANLVAIVISPGATLRRTDGRQQVRGCAAVCNPADFLDIAGGEDNADLNRTYVSAPRSLTFNDQLMPVFSDEIMQLVERRAARELAQRLREHYDAWQAAAAPGGVVNGSKGFYPYAVPFGDPATVQVGTNDTTSGMLPLASTPLVWSNASFGCVGNGTPTLTCNTLVMCILGICVPSSVSGRVENVATRFVDPPNAANFQLLGLDLGGAPSWTLNAAARRLDFSYSGIVAAGVLNLQVTAPTASAWVGTSWVTSNNWHQNAYYGLSSGYAITGANACGGAAPACLTIANTAAPNNKQAVVVMTGRALASAGQGARPIAPVPVALGQFLEGLNADGTFTGFEANAKTATFNDYPVAVRP